MHDRQALYLFFETSNGRLPLEDGSDLRETLGKRVSDNPRRFILQPRKKKIGKVFSKNVPRRIKTY